MNGEALQEGFVINFERFLNEKIHSLTVLSVSLIGAMLISDASYAQGKSASHTGSRGGSVNAQTSHQGTNFNGSANATSAKDGTASASGSAGYDLQSGTGTASGGFNGETSTGKTVSSQGTATYDSSTGTYNSTVSGTGVRGQTKGATVSGGNGTVSVTGDGGKSKTFVRSR